ncbi:hypothetical protein [Phenylobacterium sp.]|jgi:hypothetical protein|uniref:hypothetical protein n=1 Tax=Phenylobacterium sp. TaxID=1871053 RepID=UPI0037CA924A
MSALEAVLIALSVAIPLVALVAGKTPERIAALIFILATGATALSGAFWKYKEIGNLLLTIDGLMALSFLVLAVRYNYLWIALMMGAMAGYFAIHAYYMAMARPLDETFAISSNIATGVVLLSLAIGVWGSRRRPAEP